MLQLNFESTRLCTISTAFYADYYINFKKILLIFCYDLGYLHASARFKREKQKMP